jgi:hypothetical protein
VVAAHATLASSHRAASASISDTLRELGAIGYIRGQEKLGTVDRLTPASASFTPLRALSVITVWTIQPSTEEVGHEHAGKY